MSNEKKLSDISQVLTRLIQGNSKTVITEIDKSGIKYYVGDSVLSEESIQRMRELGLLVQIGFIGIISCPSCGDHVLALLPVCPRCGSNDVDIAELIAHVKCGYIGFTQEFNKSGEMICPGCGEKIISESEIRIYGKVFVCENCGARFETPSLKIRCLSCGLIFTLKEARVKRIPQYAIEAKEFEKARRVFIRDYIKNVILNVADKYGIDVKFDVNVKGMSGVDHKVPAILIRGSREAYVFFILSERDATLFTSFLLDIPETKNIILLCDESAISSMEMSCSAIAAGKPKVHVITIGNNDVSLEDELEKAVRKIFPEQSE